MNLCRTGGRKDARFRRVAATADRVRWEKRTGVGCRRHRGPGNPDPKTSRRETGRRRPSRRRPLCRGRGEAAGDCVGTAGASLPVPADRVLHVLGTRAIGTPEFLLRPGSTGRIGQGYKTRKKCKGEALKGESNESVAVSGIGPQNSAGSGRGEYTAW
jgi:hypothetical protein